MHKSSETLRIYNFHQKIKQDLPTAMKYIFATSFALAANAVAVADDYPESMEYEFDRSNYGRVPTGDFQH